MFNRVEIVLREALGLGCSFDLIGEKNIIEFKPYFYKSQVLRRAK
jgi:hypothetical protein